MCYDCAIDWVLQIRLSPAVMKALCLELTRKRLIVPVNTEIEPETF